MAEAKILLINDDQQLAGELKDKISKAGFVLSVESDAQRAIAKFKAEVFDLVIVRFEMPFLDHANLIKDLRKIDPNIMMLAYLNTEMPDSFERLTGLGIYDVLTSLVDEQKMIFQIRKGVELHNAAQAARRLTQGLNEQRAALQKQNTLLAQRVEDSSRNLTRLYEDLRTTYMRTIKTLAQVIDARDHYTHSHSQNVAKIAVAIAEEMHLFAKDIELVQEAAELHDLGKVGIQDDILIKPSGLTPEEWELMKKHPLTGAQILEPLTFLHGVIDLIRQHHEHFDGTGYPEGLKEEEILLGARIIHLADAYEAMTSARSYRQKPLTKEEAIAEIKKNSGTQFDPQIAAAFLKICDNLKY